MTTTTTYSPLAEAVIKAGKALANEAYRVSGSAEGKAAAMHHFGTFTIGGMCSDELAEFIHNAERAAKHPSSQTSRDYGRAYLATIDTLLITIVNA